MIRLSSKDAALILDVLEQPELTKVERDTILSESSLSFLPELVEIVVNPEYRSENKELTDLAVAIQNWLDTSATSYRY